MIPVIITTVAAVMFLLVLLITTIILFVNKIRKKQSLRRDLSIVIVMGLIFFSLTALDLYFISNGIIKTGEGAADKAAKATGRGFVLTYDEFKKTWDERSVLKLKNIDISVVKTKESIEDNIKTYEIEILINNKNSKAESMPISEMIEFNYLFLCDKDDIFYKIDNYTSESSFLPTGKSKATLIANIDKEVTIESLKLVDKKILLKI